MKITAPVTDYIRASIMTTQGDLAVRGAAAPERLAAGSLYTYFQGKGLGVKPEYDREMFPMSIQGDLITRGAVFPYRLAAGALGTYLKAQGVANSLIYEKLALRDTGIYSYFVLRSTGGVEIFTGIGFEPSVVIFFATDIVTANQNFSWGFGRIGFNQCLYAGDDMAFSSIDMSHSIIIRRSAVNILDGYITAVSSDGFTITWTLTGTCGLQVLYLCLP